MSLICITKYIKNKKIDSFKVNKVKYLQGISKTVWKFVSALYNAGWNLLIADVHNNSFRQKVSYYCMPKMNNIKTGKSKSKEINKLASVKRLPPPIPTKTPKCYSSKLQGFKQ